MFDEGAEQTRIGFRNDEAAVQNGAGLAHGGCRQTEKYFARGFNTTMALVDCSG